MSKAARLKELHSQLQNLRAATSGLEVYRIVQPLIDIVEQLIEIMQAES